MNKNNNIINATLIKKGKNIFYNLILNSIFFRITKYVYLLHECFSFILKLVLKPKIKKRTIKKKKIRKK